MWPVLELDDDTTTVMYPFYVHEDDFLMVFPVYYRTDEGREHHVLWPLFKTRDGRVTRVAPFWYSSDPNKYWIFPLAYHDNDSTLLLVPPSYWRGDDLQVVVPLWVRAKSATDDWLVVGPRLYGWHETATKKHTFAGVLFDHTSHSNGDRETSLLPLLWRAKSHDESSLWLAGYWRAHTPTSDSLALYPLFATKTSADAAGEPSTRELSILWPLYKRKVIETAEGQVTHRHRRFLAFADDLTPARRSLSLFGFVVRETTN